MILSPDKCCYLNLGFNEAFQDFPLNNFITENVTEEMVLGIVIDNKQNFKSLLNNICTKTNQKISTLLRTSELRTLIIRKN